MWVENDKFIGVSKDWKGDSLVAVGIGVIFLLLGRWNAIFIPGTPKTGWLAAEIGLLSMWEQTLLVVAVAPIIETIFFSCFLFGAISTILDEHGIIKNQLLRIVVVILITSTLFAGWHWTAYGISLITAYVGAFFFNTFACVFMLLRQSQLVPTILHGIINGCIFWGIFVIA